MSSVLKQVIVVNNGTEPQMRKGKVGAQCSHAALSFIFRRMKKVGNRRYEIELTEAEERWKDESYAKIVLKARDESHLLEIYQAALAAGLEVHLITDSGKTEFAGPTKTCIAIGPDFAERIDPITGDLTPL